MNLPEFRGGERLTFGGGSEAIVVRTRKAKKGIVAPPTYRLRWRLVLNGRECWLNSHTILTHADLQNSNITGWTGSCKASTTPTC
jgi:hypothetical protein